MFASEIPKTLQEEDLESQSSSSPYLPLLSSSRKKFPHHRLCGTSQILHEQINLVLGTVLDQVSVCTIMRILLKLQVVGSHVHNYEF